MLLRYYEHFTVDTIFSVELMLHYYGRFSVDTIFSVDLLLLLWCTIKTQDHVVGNSGQGMYWQGSDKNPQTG